MRETRERLFRRLFRFTRYYAWWVLLLTILITGAGVYYIQQLPLRSSYLDLLPRNDPLIEEYKENEAYLAQLDYIAILLQLEDPAGKTKAEREAVLLDAAVKIKQALDADPEFAEVTYLVEPSPRSRISTFSSISSTLPNSPASRRASTSPATRSEEASSPGSSDRPRHRLRSDRGEVQGCDLSGGGDGVGLGESSEIEQELVQLSNFNRAIIAAIDGLDGLDKVTQAVRDLTGLFSPNTEAVVRKPEGFFSADRTALLMNVKPRYPPSEGLPTAPR